MNFLVFLANVPWTVIGLLYAFVSIPRAVEFREWAMVVHIRSFWWTKPFPYLRNVRGMAIGHIVLASSQSTQLDVEHDIFHVRQAQRLPFIFPIVNALELWRHGYRNNRFEKEAYEKVGNTYNEPS